MNNTIEFRKPIDEEYRIEAARLLREWAEKKSVSMNPAVIDDNTVKALFRKVEAPVKKALYYYAKRRRMLELTRIVPNHAIEGLLRRQTHDIEYYDIPREFLNITSLVPEWEDIIARALRQ